MIVIQQEVSSLACMLLPSYCSGVARMLYYTKITTVPFYSRGILYNEEHHCRTEHITCAVRDENENAV